MVGVGLTTTDRTARVHLRCAPRLCGRERLAPSGDRVRVVCIGGVESSGDGGKCQQDDGGGKHFEMEDVLWQETVSVGRNAMQSLEEARPLTLK